MQKLFIYKRPILYFVRSCSSLLFGKCGRHASKIISVVLSLLILLSCVISSNAAEINGFYSYDMSHSAYTFENVNNVLEQVDYTNKLTVSQSTYLGTSSTNLTLPIDTSSNIRYVSSFHIENLNSTHEYNLKFKTSSNSLFDINSTVLGVYLIFYNGSTILKEQELVGVKYEELGWHTVDIDFKPDAQGLGGYKTRIEFRFLTTSKSTVTFRLSEIIEFSDKDDNSSFFERIINAIKELPSNISNGIKTFFDNLGNKFESVGNSITNKFEEVKNAIGSWFTEIGDKLSNKFAEVGNAITSKFAEIGAEFSATFDKFKPRIYEIFTWRYGCFDFDDWIIDWDNSSAVLSEDFFVPNGTEYYVTLTKPEFLEDWVWYGGFQFSILRFSADGEHEILLTIAPEDFTEPFLLEPGYYYQFELMEFYNSDFELTFPDIDLSDACNSIVRVYADEGWLTAFGRMILNGLKNFFIPSSDFFETKKIELETFCIEHFGAVYQSIDLIIDIIKKFINISPTEPCITFPSIDIPLFNETYHISDEVVYSFSWINDKSHFLYYFYNFYRGFVTLLLSLSFANYCRNKYNEVFGGGSE